MDVALLDDENTYSITLDRGIKVKKRYDMTSKEAKHLLRLIYRLMDDYSNNLCFPISMLNSEKIDSLENLIEEITQPYGVWSYFDDKKIFDYETQLGYDEDNFVEQFIKYKNEIKSLIAFIKNDEESEGDNNEQI